MINPHYRLTHLWNVLAHAPKPAHPHIFLPNSHNPTFSHSHTHPNSSTVTYPPTHPSRNCTLMHALKFPFYFILWQINLQSCATWNEYIDKHALWSDQAIPIFPPMSTWFCQRPFDHSRRRSCSVPPFVATGWQWPSHGGQGWFKLKFKYLSSRLEYLGFLP